MNRFAQPVSRQILEKRTWEIVTSWTTMAKLPVRFLELLAGLAAEPMFSARKALCALSCRSRF